MHAYRCLPSSSSHRSKRGRWSEEESHNPLSEEEEDDDEEEYIEPGDDSDDDQKSLVAEKAYQRLLPDVRKLVEELCGSEKPNLVTDKREICCAVCPTPQWFKGWKALLAHASTFTKKRIHQHRGYHRALEEGIKVNEKASGEDESGEGRAVSINPDVAKIVWPPIVIIQRADVGGDLCEMVNRFLSAEFEDLHDVRCLPVSRTCSFVVFKAESVGYFEAQMVGKWFVDRRRDRFPLGRSQEFKNDRRSIHDDRRPLLYGYLAVTEDMRSWDPEKRIVKDWTEASFYEKVQCAQRKFKQEHDKEQAMLKAMELQVETLTEDEQKFKTSKGHIQRLIEVKQQEISSHKRRAAEMEARYLDAMCKLDSSFQKDVKIFEARSAAKVKRLREDLELNERRLEEERANRTQEIEKLQKEFHVLTKNHKKKETQSALERELEVMQRRQNFMENMTKAETCFNQEAHEKESRLQEKQYSEKMQLLQEANEEKQRLYDEWLQKQEALKKQGAEAKQAKEQLEAAAEATDQVQFCIICTDPLNDDNRVYLFPCGHARMCLDCANDVYKEKGTCPDCRERIAKKPKLLPKKMFM